MTKQDETDDFAYDEVEKVDDSSSDVRLGDLLKNEQDYTFSWTKTILVFSQ